MESLKKMIIPNREKDIPLDFYSKSFSLRFEKLLFSKLNFRGHTPLRTGHAFQYLRSFSQKVYLGWS
jgi:hypothetical protein